MKYVTGVADSQQLGASRRRAAGPGLVILMSKVLERHADSSLKNQRPKQADTPGKLQLGVDCSVSILSRNTRLGWDAALLAPVFFWGILRGGHYYHTPSPHPSSASLATLLCSFQGCQDFPLWPPTEPIRRKSGALAGGMPRFIFDGAWFLGSRIEGGEGLRSQFLGKKTRGRASLVSRSLFSPSEQNSPPWTLDAVRIVAVRPVLAESGAGFCACIQQQGTCSLPACPPPGLGSEPMETARSRPALVVLDSTWLASGFMRLAARGERAFVALELNERTMAREWHAQYSYTAKTCKSRIEYLWHRPLGRRKRGNNDAGPCPISRCPLCCILLPNISHLHLAFVNKHCRVPQTSHWPPK
jgi:hypothetical protein